MPEKASPTRRSYRRSVGVGVFSFGAVASVTLVSSIVTARLYGVEAFGELALVLAPSLAMNNLSSVREQVGLVKRLSTLEPGSPRITGLALPVFAFSFAFTLLVAIPVTVGAWFVFDGPLDRPDLFDAVLVGMAGYVFVSNTSVNFETILTAFRAAEDLFWVRLHQAIGFLLAAVALHFVWDSVWGLLVATLVAWVTSTGHRIRAAQKYMPLRIDRDELRRGAGELPPIIKFGLKLTPGTIADGISHQIAPWVLGAYTTIAAVGAYSRAWLISSRFIELKGRVTEVLFPTLVERRAQKDEVAEDRALVDSVRYAAVGMLFPAAVLGAVAPGVMALFGPGFEQGADALTILMAVPAIVTLGHPDRRNVGGRPAVGHHRGLDGAHDRGGGADVLADRHDGHRGSRDRTPGRASGRPGRERRDDARERPRFGVALRLGAPGTRDPGRVRACALSGAAGL